VISNTSDAGRELTHPHETRDCTVVALAHVLGVPYSEAHKIMAAAGRRPRKGMTHFAIEAVLNSLKQNGVVADIIGKPFTSTRPTIITGSAVHAYRMYGRRPRRQGTTVAQALCSLPRTGRFYLACTTHAFAYVDGKLLDNLNKSKMRALMSSCWQIIPAATVTAKPEVKPELLQADINAMWERLNKLEGKS
jgi:hypothetical protein